MARKSNKDAPETTRVEKTVEEATSVADLPKESIPRLNLPLTDDGLKVDWDRVRPSNKAKFESVIAGDPAVRALFAPAANDGSGVLSGGITEAEVKTALDLVSQACALGFKWAAPHLVKHPLKKDAKGNKLPLVLDPAVVMQCFTLTSAQHAELDPRALALVQKHSRELPRWFQENIDWIMLGGMFLRFQAENAANAIKAQVTKDIMEATRIQTMRAAATSATPRPADDNVTRVISKQPVNGKDVSGESLEPGHVPPGIEMPPSDIERP